MCNSKGRLHSRYLLALVHTNEGLASLLPLSFTVYLRHSPRDRRLAEELLPLRFAGSYIPRSP